ncbi:hypothetical protein ASE75_13695 [Sphingomonas sp. Leaf17]|uniref:hypothetical protein n=1 Tax=Sphingomonas sp. Leaf17 TaxID=1735683 RepID=UPI0006F6B655|nr:hypothetical protein [Sphingomonas sp. Leaf17]KQM62678.1 hypothetical protein ASE75_13695 [Sphingomonas sp. Leaf17]
MGLFSAIAGIFSGGAQKKASQQAMQAQTAAYNRGIDLQQQQYDTTRADYMPYTQAGVGALGQYGNLLGANGSPAQLTAIEGLKATPFYQQSLDDANENLLQTASASGGVRGGNTAGAIGQISPAILAQYYQQALSGYGNLAQLGLGATGSVAGAGLANANAQTQLQGQIGNAQASNFLTKGGINAATINNIGGFLDQAASSFLPAGFGGISAGGTARTQGAAQSLIGSMPAIF